MQKTRIIKYRTLRDILCFIYSARGWSSIEYVKLVLVRLLFTIARWHSAECFNDVFFLIWQLLVATPCGTSRTTLCWLDVSGDRITQRHRRLVKTEHKTSKVLASRERPWRLRRIAARRFTAIKRPTLECYLLFSLSSLFARYIRFTTRTRGSTISSDMAAFVALYRVFDLCIFSLCASRLYVMYISTDMYLHGKA